MKNSRGNMCREAARGAGHDPCCSCLLCGPGELCVVWQTPTRSQGPAGVGSTTRCRRRCKPTTHCAARSAQLALLPWPGPWRCSTATADNSRRPALSARPGAPCRDPCWVSSATERQLRSRVRARQESGVRFKAGSKFAGLFGRTKSLLRPTHSLSPRQRVNTHTPFCLSSLIWSQETSSMHAWASSKKSCICQALIGGFRGNLCNSKCETWAISVSAAQSRDCTICHTNRLSTHHAAHAPQLSAAGARRVHRGIHITRMRTRSAAVPT